MSSPFRKAPSPHSSPVSRWRRSTTQSSVNGHRPSSSYREDTSSPSRQLAEELSRLYVADVKAFKHSLDLQDHEQEKLHRQALVKSLAEHEAIRESAELARQRVELEIERARRQLEAEERTRLEEERLRAEREEHARKTQQALRRQQEELERQAREDELRKQEDERRKKHEQEQEQDRLRKEKLEQETQARQRREKEEQDRKKAEAAAASAPSATTKPILPASAQSTVTTEQNGQPGPLSAAWKNLKAAPVLTPHGVVSSADQREAEHNRYMEMHKRLKEMRTWVAAQARNIPGRMNQLSEMRRTIKKVLGMLNAVDKTLNKKPMDDIQAILDEAAKMTELTLSPAPFIVALDQQSESSEKGPYPAALLFLLNYFAKYVLQRFTDQVCRDPKAAEPYGVLLVTVFGSTTYHYNSHSLIDILWAKFHKVCPVLFGICGNEKTVSGKHRLGWKFEKDFGSNQPGAGAFIGTEEHLGNQAGLATGFAAITLRDFARSRKQNPAPNRLFWTAMARVLSTPPPDRTSTHFVVARNMVELYIPRFIHFFGGAAIAALRKLFRDWPREANDKRDPNVLALDGMPLFIERDHQLVL